MGDQSAYIPTRPRGGSPSATNFYAMAREKGWTEEQLRRSYDLPRTQLPPGVALVKHNFDLTEDPFKDKPPSNAQQEFDVAETRFYDRLKKITLVQQPGEDQKTACSVPRNRSRMSSQGVKRTSSKPSAKK